MGDRDVMAEPGATGEHGAMGEHTATGEHSAMGERGAIRALTRRLLPLLLVGDHPVWETRVRNEETYLETTDRTLQRFLQIHASSPNP